MAKLHFTYTGLEYSQRKSGSLITFVAPVGEIKTWAGVPRKHFNYQHGFQRSLVDSRVEALRNFYAEDQQNITPTAIVVAVREGAWKIKPICCDGLQSENPGLCEIAFELADLSEEPTDRLIQEALKYLRDRLGSVTESVESDLNAAVQVAIEAETEDEAEDSGVAAFDSVSDLDDAPMSHLLHFFTELLAIREGKMQLEDEPKLREVLYSLLKPATIVDGQHRVYGAAALSESMRFAVNAIVDADWLEQVFQFVVINQKAKAIQPAFLHSIVATSLTDDEISKLYKRLRKSGVDVEKAQFMTQINTDPKSPFRSMIDFEVEGSPGFLKFPGMSSIARDFKNIQRTYPSLVEEGVSWEHESKWIAHFFAFWQGVRDYFQGMDVRLWKQPSESNPNNLLKIVSLQEIQRIVLESWADARDFKLSAPEETYARSKRFWDGFPSQFFTDEWKKKGLQTAVGRKYLSEAIQLTRRNQDKKNWGHRRLGLFQDI